MAERKPLEELTIMDDYMFYAVMKREDLLKPLLETILGIKIKKITYSEGQKTIKQAYDSKGVRLDVYVEDENGRTFDIEVQASNQYNLPLRSRFYLDVIDVAALEPGYDYNDLGETYVIFITAFDPKNKGHYLYWFENRDKYDHEILLDDKAHKVFVNVAGTNGVMPKGMKGIIEYFRTGKAKTKYTKAIDEEVRRVKQDEERKAEYMQIMRREAELRNEGINQQATTTAEKMLKKNKPLSEIVDFSGLTEAAVKALAEKLEIKVVVG